MKNLIKTLALATVGLLMSVSCSGGSATKSNKAMNNKGKVLIVFFSHAGAFSIYGHETRKDLSKVDKWLKRLNF